MKVVISFWNYLGECFGLSPRSDFSPDLLATLLGMHVLRGHTQMAPGHAHDRPYMSRE